jgi:hypothetical protein
MQDNGGGDAGRNGNDGALPPVRKNAKGKHREAGQQSQFEKVQGHRFTVLAARRIPPAGLGMIAVAAVQVRQQQQLGAL